MDFSGSEIEVFETELFFRGRFGSDVEDIFLRESQTLEVLYSLLRVRIVV